MKDADVLRAIAMHKAGYVYQEIANTLAVSKSNIASIMQGKIWGWLTGLRKQ